MRALCLCAVLFTALPATAAERQALLKLKYCSAVQLEQALYPPVTPDKAVVPASIARPEEAASARRGLAPDGLSSCTVDAEHNAVRLTGTPEALDQVRSLARLLDVPARHLALRVRVLPDTPETRAWFAGVEGADEMTVLPAQALAGLEALHPQALRDSIYTASNNTPLHLQWSAGTELRVAALTARINSDGTVTSWWAQTVGQGGAADALPLLRRAQPGAATARRLRTGELAVVDFQSVEGERR